MKRFVRVLVVLGVLCSALSSCATMKWRPLAPGELRLLNIQAPERMQENLPYDLAIIFKADGQPRIKKVCFRLFAQRSSDSPAAQLSCFSYEVETNRQVYTDCRPWESPYSHISSLACSSVVSVKYGEEKGKRDWLLARIPSDFLRNEYNKLECHVEYVLNGELKVSNRVSVPVRIVK